MQERSSILNRIMKRIIAAVVLLFVMNAVSAQEETSAQTKGFKKENVFVGGGVNVGLSSGTFQIGVLPEVGYSVAQWLDAGLAFNINYFSIKPEYNYNVKQHTVSYGAGVFTRIYPVKFLFLQLQPELNWLTTKETDLNTGITGKYAENSSSVLGGIGYTNRIVGRSSFYVVLMMDLTKDINSPYRDYNGNADPVFRTGFNIYLHSNRNK
jgi:hypothetical protein